jgi:hypothetical protein
LDVARRLQPARIASAAAQTAGASSFRVYQHGALIGTIDVSVARTEDGWRIQGTSHLAGTVNLTVKQLDLRYDAWWRGRFMTLELVSVGGAVIVHVAVLGTSTRTDIVTENEVRFRSHSVSPDTVFLPDDVFGAYEALAARLAASPPGMDVPLFVVGTGETRAVVDMVVDEQVKTGTGTITARRYTLRKIGASPEPIDVWVDRGRLLRVDLPHDGVSVVRSDVLQ